MALHRGRVILIVVIAVLAVSLWRMYLVELEKQQIAASYAKASRLVEQLQGEHKQLTDQLVNARQTVEGQAGRIGSLEQDLQNVDQQLKETLTELAALQREHDELRRNHATLTEQFDAVAAERQQLERKLSSLKELKLAIREVRRQMWNQRWVAWRARMEAQRQADVDRLASGNRGYLVRNGMSTVRASSQLQVHVLEPQPQ